jgi:hypothetical protein
MNLFHGFFNLKFGIFEKLQFLCFKVEDWVMENETYVCKNSNKKLDIACCRCNIIKKTSLIFEVAMRFNWTLLSIKPSKVKGLELGWYLLVLWCGIVSTIKFVDGEGLKTFIECG